MKKSFLAILAAFVAVLSIGTQAINLDSAENPSEAVLSASVTPGYNALTGTKEPATFEEDDTSYFASIVPDSTYNGSTKAIFPQATGASFRVEQYYWNRYGYIRFTVFTPEAGRKYHIEFDEYVEKETALTTTWGAFVGNTESGGNHLLHTNKTALGETWQSFTADFVSNGTQFALQQRFCPDSGTNGTTIALYLDNIAFYPYYKITYSDYDGTDLASEWVLLDDNGELLTAYTPDASLIENKYTAFTTSIGGKKVTSVALDGADIVLYPYSEAFTLTVNDYVLNAGTTEKATVTASSEVDFTVDTGDCGATYSSTGTEVVITPGKYSGVVTVSAELDGEIKSEKIYIVNGTLALPGHNAITGTREKASFDDEYSAYASIGTINNQYYGLKVSDNPKKTTSNASDKALNISQYDWQRYGMFTFGFLPEKDRQYTIIFDEYVSKSSEITKTLGVLLDYNGNGSNLTIHQNKTGFDKDWQTISGTFVSGGTSLQLNQRFCEEGTTNGTAIEIYMDNVAIYPHYKVTYLDYDGSVAATEWVLLDESGKLLTEYTPDLSLVASKGITAVSLTDGGEIVEKVTLGTSDITLYPVKTELVIAYDSNVITATEGNTATLTADRDVSWTIDTGASEATYETTAKTATITAKGYSGVVTVSATDGESTKTVTVYLVNGTKSKPGINVITGTTEKADFNDEYGAYASIGTINNQYSALKISANSKVTDLNGSAKTLNISQPDWQRYGLFTFAFTPEAGRNYTIMFDEYVAKDTAITETFGALLDVDGNGSNLVFHSNNQGFGTDWQTFVGNFESGGTSLKLQQRFCSASGTNGTNIEIYLDNIAIYPDYKITYMNFDGSVAETAWVLLDGEGNLASTFTPDTSIVEGATGFSLTEGGTAVTSV
ncbi:MAG: hypothetical protein IJZ20_06265, partial [Clostridia bacterium]|nr:hypothetical protein [Clostridia bacterium]